MANNTYAVRAIVHPGQGWAHTFGIDWLIEYERWSCWEKLAGVRDPDDVILEYRRTLDEGALAGSIVVEFVCYPAEVGVRMIEALGRRVEAAAALGYVGWVTEPPADPRLLPAWVNYWKGG